jgi:hypothetical protein
MPDRIGLEVVGQSHAGLISIAKKSLQQCEDDLAFFTRRSNRRLDRRLHQIETCLTYDIASSLQSFPQRDKNPTASLP